MSLAEYTDVYKPKIFLERVDVCSSMKHQHTLRYANYVPAFQSNASNIMQITQAYQWQAGVLML